MFAFHLHIGTATGFSAVFAETLSAFGALPAFPDIVRVSFYFQGLSVMDMEGGRTSKMIPGKKIG